MEISISTPMPDDGNCQVIEHLEARPLRARRGWSAEARARLVEKTRVARAAIRNEAVDADRPMRFERFAAVSCALVEIVIGEVVLRVGSDVEPNHLANVIRAVRKA